MSWHYGFRSARAIVRETIQSNPPLYRRIAAATSVSDPDLDKIVSVLLDEVKSRSAVRKRYAFRLISASMIAIEGDDYELQGASPKQRKLVFNLLCRSLRNDDRHLRVWAIRALRHYITEDLGEQHRIVRILIEDGIANQDPAAAQWAIAVLREDVDRDVASEAVPALISALAHSDDDVRARACEALRYFYKDSLEAVPALVRLVLTDTSDVVGLAAVRALMRIVSVEELVQRLGDAAGDLKKLLRRLRIGGKPLRDLRRRLQKPITQPISGGATQQPKRKRTKRSGPSQQAQHKRSILIGALVEHHRFGQPEENLDAATQEQLVRTTLWNQSKLSRAIQELFGPRGMSAYKERCAAGTLKGILTKKEDGTFEVDAVD